MSIKKSFVFGIEIGSPLFLLLFIRPTVSGVLELAFQNCGCSHRRAPAVERTPSGKSKPRFVPQKDEVRLDSEALFHDPLSSRTSSFCGTKRGLDLPDGVRSTER